MLRYLYTLSSSGWAHDWLQPGSWACWSHLLPLSGQIPLLTKSCFARLPGGRDHVGYRLKPQLHPRRRSDSTGLSQAVWAEPGRGLHSPWARRPEHLTLCTINSCWAAKLNKSHAKVSFPFKSHQNSTRGEGGLPTLQEEKKEFQTRAKRNQEAQEKRGVIGQVAELVPKQHELQFNLARDGKKIVLLKLTKTSDGPEAGRL